MGDLVSSIPRSDAHLVDYYENSGEGVAFYAQILKEKDQRGWDYGKHTARTTSITATARCRQNQGCRLEPGDQLPRRSQDRQQDGFPSRPPATSSRRFGSMKRTAARASSA